MTDYQPDLPPDGLPSGSFNRYALRWAWPAALLGLAILAIWLFVFGALELPSQAHRATVRVDRTAKPPAPELNLVKPLSPEDAFAENMAIPAVAGPIEAQRPFMFPAGEASSLSHLRAVDCLTAAIYYEAASETAQGQRAVAQIVLNRVRHPAYPNSVCGVVYQGSERATGCQFTFTCDGSLRRTPSLRGWEVARGIAEMALEGKVEPSVGTATHYHTVFVVPYWAASLQKIATIGAHIFYRFGGFWGKRAAFTDAYAGEPTVESDPLTTAEAVLDDAAADTAVQRPTLVLPPTAILAPPGGRLAVPDQNPTLLVDERRGQLIADERSGSAPPGSQAPAP